jgi:hypothetical protein
MCTILMYMHERYEVRANVVLFKIQLLSYTPFVLNYILTILALVKVKFMKFD